MLPMALETRDDMMDEEDVVQVDVEWLPGARVEADSATLVTPVLGELCVRFAPHSTMSRTGECLWAGCKPGTAVSRSCARAFHMRAAFSAAVGRVDRRQP